MLSDPLEAAELLATQGELPSAIKRLTLGSPPPAMLPLATRLRLHGYALRLVEVCSHDLVVANRHVHQRDLTALDVRNTKVFAALSSCRLSCAIIHGRNLQSG